MTQILLVSVEKFWTLCRDAGKPTKLQTGVLTLAIGTDFCFLVSLGLICLIVSLFLYVVVNFMTLSILLVCLFVYVSVNLRANRFVC